MVMVSLICVLLAFFKLFRGFGMDLSLKTEEEEVGKFGTRFRRFRSMLVPWKAM